MANANGTAPIILEETPHKTTRRQVLEQGARQQNPKKQSIHLLDEFRNAERAPYELAYLLRRLPADANSYEQQTPEVTGIASAAEMHANNSLISVLNGLEAIGSLLVKVGCSNESDGIDTHEACCLGDVIKHLAVEAQMLSELTEEMGRIAKGGVQ